MKTEIFMRKIIIAGSLLVTSLTYTYLQFGNVKPWCLNGPQFLIFFGILTVLAYATVLAQVIFWKARPSTSVPPWNALILWIEFGGILRLLQGIHNSRPVGFLMAMLLANILGYVIMLYICSGIYAENKKKNTVSKARNN